MKKRYPFILHLTLWATACIALSCHPQPHIPITIQRLSNRVVTYEYHHVSVNVTAVKSRSGILIIDTHCSPATMNTIMRLVEEEFGKTEIAFVINTHGDYDHTAGNQLFAGATIIGHTRCPDHMRRFPANSPQTIRSLTSDISELEETLRNTDYQVRDELREEITLRKEILESIKHEYIVTPPAKTFDDTLTLHLDDISVHLFYCGAAHTDNDIIIYIPEEQLVLSGDLFTSKSSFGFSVSPTSDGKRVLTAMSTILHHPSGVKYVIPGHGAVMSGDDFAALRDMLAERLETHQRK